MTSETYIHPTAIIADSAKIGIGVHIGPYCVVGEKVTLGDRVRLHSHVVIEGRTFLGNNAQVFPFASIGQPPQDLKFHGEDSELIIGERTVIREHATLSPGTEGGGMKTVVGNDCLIMIGCHIAHDCIVGNRVIMSNNATLAGHVAVGDFAILGGLSAVHQFVRIGNNAMIGGMSGVEHDVIPYGLVRGERASLQGLNLTGMERRGIDRKDMVRVRKAFTDIFMSDEGTLADRIERVALDYADNEIVLSIVDFVRNKSKHGVLQLKSENAR